ncbi:MAG: prenyltransferase [Candidatus Woesearchaeota archaeon]
MNFKDIIKISRPRFWLYYAGTYAVGYSLAATSIEQFGLIFLTFLLYFTLPANFFVYGINDYFDFDTDRLNPKKKHKEYLLKQENKKTIKKLLYLPLLLTLPLIILDPRSTIFIGLFLLLGALYSMEPIRFKARPFLDSISNVFYVIPGFLGYFQLTGTIPNIYITLAALIWPVAMHLYSAVPDIKPDKKAKLKTTAIKLGKTKSLILCSTLWLTVSILIMTQNIFLGILALVYVIIPLLSFKDTIKIYWYYPYINAIIGFILFWFGGTKWSGLF